MWRLRCLWNTLWHTLRLTFQVHSMSLNLIYEISCQGQIDMRYIIVVIFFSYFFYNMISRIIIKIQQNAIQHDKIFNTTSEPMTHFYDDETAVKRRQVGGASSQFTWNLIGSSWEISLLYSLFHNQEFRTVMVPHFLHTHLTQIR